MTTPPETTLAERIEQALRDAAFSCDGHCGLTERDCDAQHPIQVSAWHHGEVGSVYADIPALAAVVAAAVQAELDAARAENDWLRQQLAELAELLRTGQYWRGTRLVAESRYSASEIRPIFGWPEPTSVDAPVEVEHACDNCEGIDPTTCLVRPARAQLAT